MSVQIQGFSQPSTVTVSSFENNGAQAHSSFGPKNCLRLRADAATWSKNGGSVQIRGIGNRSLLHAKSLRLVQPLEVRFKQFGGNQIVFPNAFLDSAGCRLTQKDNVAHAAKVTEFFNGALNSGAMAVFNGLSMRPNGFAKSCTSMVLSLNGTSWQCKPKSFLDAFEKIFCENRYDSMGRATACPPYTNCPRHGSMKQPGSMEACKQFLQNARILHMQKNRTGSTTARLEDIVFGVDLVTTIPVGPLLLAHAPGMQSLVESELHCLPHVRTLDLEWVLDTDPLQKWFQTVSTDIRDSLAVDCSDLTLDASAGINQLEANAISGIDFAGMWRGTVCQTSTIATAAALAQGTWLNIQRPYLTYVLSEPDLARVNYRPLYSLPSYSFVTYNQQVVIPAGSAKAKCIWDYIQVDNLSALVCCSVFESDKPGAGGSVGPRGPRRNNVGAQGTAIPGALGAGAHSICAGIDYSSLKINLTVANQVLGNFTGNLETAFDQYRVFLKYSKTRVSFEDWKLYNRMLIFSPQELCGVAPALTEMPVTLSISFDFERTASDSVRCVRDFLNHEDDPHYYPVTEGGDRGTEFAKNYDCGLFFLNQEVCTLSPGQCGIQRISYSPEEIQGSFAGAPKQLRTQVQDQYVIQ